jgi:hypothetical protein
VAVHAPIGSRAVLAEWLGWRARARDFLLVAFSVVLAGMGLQAVFGVFA